MVVGSTPSRFRSLLVLMFCVLTLPQWGEAQTLYDNRAAWVSALSAGTSVTNLNFEGPVPCIGSVGWSSLVDIRTERGVVLSGGGTFILPFPDRLDPFASDFGSETYLSTQNAGIGRVVDKQLVGFQALGVDLSTLTDTGNANVIYGGTVLVEVFSSVGAVSLGTFVPGHAADFLEYGGTAEFTVSGLSPLAHASGPLGFPIKLGFNTSVASFTMTPIVDREAPTLLPPSTSACVVGRRCVDG